MKLKNQTVTNLSIIYIRCFFPQEFEVEKYVLVNEDDEVIDLDKGLGPGTTIVYVVEATGSEPWYALTCGVIRE